MKDFDEHSERHIFLYAKDHYKRTDLIKDLTKIVAHITLLEEDHIKEFDIAYWVGFACLLPILKKYPNKIDEILNRWYNKKDFIESCLGLLSIMNIHEIGFDLGKPDPSILPLTKE